MALAIATRTSPNVWFTADDATILTALDLLDELQEAVSDG